MMADAICSCAVFYLKGLYVHLTSQGFYDVEGRFDVSEKLCIVLNNMQEVSYKLQDIFELMGVEKLNDKHLQSIRDKQGEKAAQDPFRVLTLKKVCDEAINNAGVELRHAATMATCCMERDVMEYMKKAVFDSQLVDAHANEEITIAQMEEVMQDSKGDILETAMLW